MLSSRALTKLIFPSSLDQRGKKKLGKLTIYLIIYLIQICYLTAGIVNILPLSKPVRFGLVKKKTRHKSAVTTQQANLFVFSSQLARIPVPLLKKREYKTSGLATNMFNRNKIYNCAITLYSGARIFGIKSIFVFSFMRLLSVCF